MNTIKLFESKQVRSVWNKDDQKWYYSVSDVVTIRKDSINVKDYIKKMRKCEPALDGIWGTICPPLELIAPGGKRRKTQCANVEGLLRIIQSIPSPKAEPFKRWLAKVGSERLEEIENPELATKRMRDKEMLLRVIIEPVEKGLKVISVYRTSKIDKYWMEEERYESGL